MASINYGDGSGSCSGYGNSYKDGYGDSDDCINFNGYGFGYISGYGSDVEDGEGEGDNFEFSFSLPTLLTLDLLERIGE